jgi:hypothetical protein
MRHSVTGDEHLFPDNPGVVADQQERGWQVVETGLVRNPRKKVMPDPSEQYVVLEITCGRPGDPEHGEQVLVRVALDPQRPEHIFLIGAGEWQTRDADDGFRYVIEHGPRTDSHCPVRGCPTHVTHTAETLRKYLEALSRHSDGHATRQRVPHNLLI